MTTPDAAPQPSSKRRHRKWWPLLGILLGALAGLVAYRNATPIYQASTTVAIIPQRVPEDIVRSTVTASLGERLNLISQQILSRTRLGRIIEEFNLYERERELMIMEDVVAQMRRDISLNVSLARDDEASGSFAVGFQSPDARTAMRVTERLASLFVQENIEDRTLLADQTSQFLQQQGEDLRRRLVESQEVLTAWNQRSGGRPVRADLAVEHEVLLKQYQDLMIKIEESRTAVNLERRQIGEQFKVIDGARLPERPVGPARWPYLVRGAVGGLVASLLLMLLTSVWHRRRHPVPQP